MEVEQRKGLGAQESQGGVQGGRKDFRQKEGVKPQVQPQPGLPTVAWSLLLRQHYEN